MKDLTEIRKEIDEVDTKLLELYEKRLLLAEDVARFKIENGKKVYDKEREIAKLKALSSLAHDDFSAQGINQLFEQIMSTSRKKQYTILAEHGLLDDMDFSGKDSFDFTGKKVVYQGVEGAYSQLALKQFFGDYVLDSDTFHVKTWKDAMEAIVSGKADYAVLPIENSSAGSITENYDLLMDYDVTIIGQQIINVNHSLLGIKGANISDIKSVYSHPQALMQCSKYLSNKHSDWSQNAVLNTAVAAKKVSDDNDKSKASIGSILNANIYGLDVLEECIQDNTENQTRFIIVGSNKEYLNTADKISICFELPNTDGSLYGILSHFAFNGLNMSLIESRPIKGKNWEYRFFIDITGNLKQEAVMNALLGIREEASFFKVLGNY